MNDTPEHIKDLQLQLWLSKAPVERLKQMMIDNESFFQFCRRMGNKALSNGESELRLHSDESRNY